jgi:hypothetical protein
MVWVRERSIPTERPPLVGEVIANFCGSRVTRGQRDGSLRPYSGFSRQELLLFYQVAPQLYSRGWVDPVPDPLLFFCSARDPWICSQELRPLDHRGGLSVTTLRQINPPAIIVANSCKIHLKMIFLPRSLPLNVVALLSGFHIKITCPGHHNIIQARVPDELPNAWSSSTTDTKTHKTGQPTCGT